MAFEFVNTNIPDLMIIKPHIYEDHRGVYKKYFEEDCFSENGIKEKFSECSDLHSLKGALRGLHYQNGESQSKLIRVIAGSLFDVAVDLRPNSPTFGKYHTELLSADNDISVYIPKGFAHGFIALEDNTIFSYMCGGKYMPEQCGGILWNDTELNIPWPLEEFEIKKVIATEKDLGWPSYREVLKLVLAL